MKIKTAGDLLTGSVRDSLSCADKKINASMNRQFIVQTTPILKIRKKFLKSSYFIEEGFFFGWVLPPKNEAHICLPNRVLAFQ